MPANKRKRVSQANDKSTTTSAAVAEQGPASPSSISSGADNNKDAPMSKRAKGSLRNSLNTKDLEPRNEEVEADEDEDDDDDDDDDDEDDEDDEDQLSLEERLERGEGGERGTMRMADPPKAGLVDPKGYKTNPPPVGRPVRIYADGVFDLFHLGHMRQLEQAKQAFPEVYLIVGVTGDKETHRRKGLTVMSAKERAESVRHCKWVDEVVEDCPWIIADAPEFMDKYAIDYVAHDDIPYGADEGDDIYSPIKAAGKFLVTQRTEGVSTTGIITNIVKDYDKFIARQLKRGATRQELNVSWVKKNELDIKHAFTEVRDNIRNNWMTTGQELTRELRAFWNRDGHGRGTASGTASRVGSRPTSPTSPTKERSDAAAKGNRSPTGTSSGGVGGGDFAAGYSLGLIGGVRAWMSKSRRNLNDTRHDGSEDVLSNDENTVNGSGPSSPASKKRARRSSVQQAA